MLNSYLGQLLVHFAASFSCQYFYSVYQ